MNELRNRIKTNEREAFAFDKLLNEAKKELIASIQSLNAPYRGNAHDSQAADENREQRDAWDIERQKVLEFLGYRKEPI